MADTPSVSQASLLEADRDHAQKSRYGGLGAAGYIHHDPAAPSGAFLSNPGEVAVIDPRTTGLQNFQIAFAWDNVAVENETNVLKKMFKTTLREGVDLDLGCLYVLKNGLRGGIQAFGKVHGALDQEPFIALSADERTGDREGPDEMIWVSGANWDKIEKILIYVYIYDGAENWATVRPQVQVRVPGEEPMVVTLTARKEQFPVCAVAGIESVRGGIKLTSYLEYFPGHAEMDRAFGYGVEWESGSKDA